MAATACFVEAPVSYNRRDLIMHALSVGAHDLCHVYEHADDFAAFPTFAAALLHKGTATDIVDFPSPTLLKLFAAQMQSLPGVRGLLDAERYIERVRQLPTGAGTHELKLRSRCVGIAPKRNGALVHTEAELRDADEQLFYRLHTTAYAVGASDASAFGRSPFAERVELPSRPCDASHLARTGANMALLYRLSGDYNPIHADPDAARLQGLEAPIAHGLCTLGFAVRAVLLLCARNDARMFKAVRARFVGTVQPGQTLRTRMWMDASHARRVVFCVHALGEEDGCGGGPAPEAKLVIDNACVELLADAERATPLKARL